MEDFKYNIKPMDFEVDKDGNLEGVPALEDRFIEKRGHVIEFTVSQVEANIKHNEKTLREFTANQELNTAKVENIEHHHPFVTELSEEDLFTAHMYQEHKNTVDMFDKKIAQLEAQIQSDKDELEVIKSQIPELNNIESPYEGAEDEGDDK